MRIRVRHIAAIILGVLSVFTVDAQVNAEQVMRIGRNVLSMDDYMLAIQYFNQAIKAKPYLSEPYYYRAVAKMQLDDYKGAEEDCTLAIERNEFKTEAYKLRGYVRQHLGKDSLAIADYNKGLGHNPYDRDFLFYKGIAQTEMKEYESADSTFGVLLRAHPGFEDGYTARARLNIERGDTTSALSDIAKTLSLSPTILNAWLLRAGIEADRHEWDTALSDIGEAIRLRPQEPALYINRAYLRYNTDDFFGAMSDYNYAVELEPDNQAAIFNRALLRYEVKDLEKAASDFSEVIRLNPTNYHAYYNRGLVYLELGQPKKALADFNAVAKRYPRFYPAHYAIAQAQRDAGNMRAAIASARHAEDLVARYVKDPEKNPLDRPTIGSGTSTGSESHAVATEGSAEADMEVMDRFNRLVTISADVKEDMAFNDKIKGRVQDRNVRVEPEPPYFLSYFDTAATLQSLSNYFRELDNLNNANYLGTKIYLSNAQTATNTAMMQKLFAMIDDYTSLISTGKGRPVDRLARGLAYSAVKNYENAIADFDAAIEALPDFTVAYMARAWARQAEGKTVVEPGDGMSVDMRQKTAFQGAMSDYNEALKLNPRLVFAWFNKGDMYYEAGDYTSALQCFTEAIETDPLFGQAYFNRALTYLALGNKTQAFADLSKAGELGIIPSYNLLKRMK